MAEPLSIIFQESYNSGNLPHDWKTANIVPIYKKGDRADPNNYRPVSLTSVPCKLMESIIKDNIAGFLEKKNKAIISARLRPLLPHKPTRVFRTVDNGTG